MKVFCVGRNKTGTSTMEAVLRSYGLKVAPQARTEYISHRAPCLFWPFVDRFEAFQDAPFSHSWLIEPLFKRYPDALYILTTRDPEAWFRSMVNHHFSLFRLPRSASKPEIATAMKRQRYITRGYLDRVHRRQFGITDDSQLYDRARYIENLARHNDLVRATIPTAQLLEIDVSQHSTTETVGAFIGRSDVMPMPRENQRL